MADTLTRDLARVYGKDHLSVAVTEDGKSYACRRGDKPGTDLSDGERTTLSLLYFLRKLEDEQVPGGDPLQRIVVIDDPSSSLDREALFATHQWLVDTLKGFGQYVVLTHDFSLLRLFIKSHRNAWGKSMKQINDGNADEARFPKVAFLEMYAAVVNGDTQKREIFFVYVQAKDMRSADDGKRRDPYTSGSRYFMRKLQQKNARGACQTQAPRAFFNKSPHPPA